MNRTQAAFAVLATLLGALCLVRTGTHDGRSSETFAADAPASTENTAPADAAQNQMRGEAIAGAEPIPAGAAIPQEPPALPPPQSEAADDYDILFRNLDPRLADDSHVEDILRDRLWLAVDELNCPIVGSLRLTTVERERLKMLIADNLVAAANRAAAAAPEGTFDFEAQLDAVLGAQRDDFNAQFRQLLGGARFDAYLAVQEDLSQFNRVKFLNANEPLADDQVRGVLSAIADEKQVVASAAARAWAEDGTDPRAAPPEELARWSSDIRQLIEARVYDRLKTILSSERLAAFAEFQSRASPQD